MGRNRGTKKTFLSSQQKVERLLKLECRLGHIPYSDAPTSVYFRTTTERDALANEITELVSLGLSNLVNK